MTMTHQPLPLSQEWAQRVVADGAVELGRFTQPQLLAAEVDLDSSPAESRELKSSFERLDPHEQRSAIEAARLQAIDPQLLAVLNSASGDPLVRGTWQCTPPWFRPLTATVASTLLGVALPDGSMASLDAANDFATSEVTVTIRTLPDQARALATRVFSSPPPAPEDVAPGEGWNDEGSGSFAMLSLVWPHGRGTRVLMWRITQPTRDSETALLQIRRDYGMKRSANDNVTEAELTVQLQDALEQAWAQGR
jgi:hypothetical protein